VTTLDEVADPIAALDVLIDLGVRRVLTAGGPGSARASAIPGLSRALEGS
jgi:copper homeostasis protein CutC